MSSQPIPMPPMSDGPPLSAAAPNPTRDSTTPSPVPPQAGGLIPSIHITAPSTPDLIGIPLPSYHPSRFPSARGQPEFIVIDGVRYYRAGSQAAITNSQVDSSANSRPRFQRLVEELAEACDTTATDPEETMGEILKNWNQSRSVDQSGASTPEATGLNDTEGEEDGSNKIKVTLIYDALKANQIDAPVGGRKILHLAQTKLERILGPETNKAKLPEIRNGSVILQDVFPTTFNAIRKWLSGKAILHGLPGAVRGNPLRELVHIYVQAARWGHRSIVHDSVNNMPLLGSPFEFLETCAIVYEEGCAGVAFRNFFKKGLPMVLGNSKFDQIEKVPAVLKQSGELATDFAETMLGLVSQRKYGGPSSQAGPQPFPAFTARDNEPAWYQPYETAYCACGLHGCTCSSDSASIVRPSDTHTIPRRSGYVETAPPSEVSEETWTEPARWAQHDGGAGWDHLHRPVPTGGIIPAPSMSVFDAEDQPMRPHNWSSAHLRHGSEWGGVGPSETGTDGWGYNPSAETPAQYEGETDSFTTGPHVQFRTPSQEIVQLSPGTQATARLEARLREVEKKLSETQLETKRQPNDSAQVARREQTASSLAVPSPKPPAIRGKPLATSKVPPAALMHPGLPPVGMPNYVPGFGYNRYVNVGNGVVHPTGPGPYGLAGRTMVATRDSNVWDCTTVFRAGDIIECVVPVEEGRSTTQHNPWNFSGQRLQGICRTQAGSFPSSFVREAGDPGLSARPTMAGNARTPTSATPAPPFPQATSVRDASQTPQPQGPAATPKAAAPSTKSKVAGNVDSSWLQSTTSSGEVSDHAPGRGRSSSTPSTAFRVSGHQPGCLSKSDWRRPCTCYCQRASGSDENSHAWKPSSVWTNDGWDAPDAGIREV